MSLVLGFRLANGGSVVKGLLYILVGPPLLSCVLPQL